MAFVFEQYRQLEGLSPDDLARELNCSRDTLLWMSLCRKPEGDTRREQVTAIAERHGVTPLSLARILRHVEIMATLAMSTRDEQTGTSRIQLAARDRIDRGDDDEPTP
ncbi:hypothetical protein DRW03_32800 [Corallococcus sp. H22C18031201]|nr:hypothetical protein [Citreicoccus inhibens]RJS15677.1 hypothetical protein DRW03_32800 [Corallococcus sp. H22C18031201]